MSTSSTKPFESIVVNGSSVFGAVVRGSSRTLSLDFVSRRFQAYCGPSGGELEDRSTDRRFGNATDLFRAL
jgi:hypothetical protein